jgi:hypothetical protein
MNIRNRLCGLGALAFCILSSGAALADADSLDRVNGETIYVPAFSHILTYEKRREPLASTMVFHNVDPKESIFLRSVTYHNQAGEALKSFLTEPVELVPFESSSFLTELNDTSGGVGANYVVVWSAPNPSLSPIAHAVMVGGSGTQGISYVTDGRVIERLEASQ